jgi:hypothetical protein
MGVVRAGDIHRPHLADFPFRHLQPSLFAKKRNRRDMFWHALKRTLRGRVSKSDLECSVQVDQ